MPGYPGNERIERYGFLTQNGPGVLMENILRCNVKNKYKLLNIFYNIIFEKNLVDK